MASVAPVEVRYDAIGRIQSVNQGPRQQTIAYNTRNELTTATDALNRIMRFEYDAAERVTKQILPDLREIRFSYDGDGNLTSVTPPSRPSHTFTFTPVNLIDRYIPPAVSNGGDTSFRYNTDRQLTLITRPDGETITPAYDGAGRLSALQTSAAAYTYGYDSAGRLATVSNPAGSSLGYSYDGSLLTQQQWSGPVSGTVSYGYDADLRLTSENGISYAYDADSLLTRAGALTLSRAADTGFLTGTSMGMLSDAYTYNTFGETSEYSLMENRAAVYNQQYTRDDGGRITSRTEAFNGTSTTFGYRYDTAGRLASVTRDGTQITAYSYNENSGRSAKIMPGATYSATYDDQDRLLTFGGTTYSYTQNGELSAKTAMNGTTSYTYDALGNLRTVVLPDKRIDYVIDGQNRRVGKKVNGTLVQGWLYGDQLRIVAELDGTGTIVSQFVYGTHTNVPDYMIHGGNTYRFITDHVGSPRFLIEAATADAVERIDYDEFGNVLGDSAPGFQPFGFAGGLYDADTGLTRFGARDYDAQTGRWTTKDPIGFSGGETGLYSYAANDPVNLIDPDGFKVYPANFVGPLKPGDRLMTPADIAAAALANVGKTAWATNRRRGNFGAGKNKCNLFVYEMAAAAGASGPTINGRPATAGELADPTIDIPGWPVVQNPHPGDIVAGSHSGQGFMQWPVVGSLASHLGATTGHAGIVTGDYRSTSASDAVVRTTMWPWRPDDNGYTTVTFRHCSCSQ
jgi:RHS repeat-associated protein